MKKYLFFLFLFSILVWTYAAGVSEEKAGSAVEKDELPLTVHAAVYKGPSGFGMIRLFEDNPEIGKGITVEYSVLPTPREMVARVATGEVDIAVFPVNIAAKMYTEGPGYKLGAVTGLGVFSLMSRENITSWNDLKGKTVYSVGKGATPEYLFSFLAGKNRIDLKDLTVDYSVTSASQLAQLIIGGKVQSAVLPEPFVTLVRIKSSDVKTVINFQEEWKKAVNTSETFPVTVVVIKPELIRLKPEAVKKFLTAYRDSIDWVNSNPKKAALLIEKYGVLSAAVAEPAIPGCNLKFIPAGKAKPLVEDFLSVLLKADPDSIGGTLPDEDFYLEE